MLWLLTAAIVVVQNGTTNEFLAGQRVMVLKPSQQGMPQFLDTLVTNRKGMARTTVQPDSMTLVATEYLGALYAQPLLPGMDTIVLTVYDTGQATLGALSYQGLFHSLGDTVPGFFMIEAVEVRFTEPIRGRLDLSFPVPEGAQVLQVFPQSGWDMSDTMLVFSGYLNPDQPVLQIQWVWQENTRTTLRRRFPKALSTGTLYAQPGFTLKGTVLGESREETLPQGKFVAYTLKPMDAFTLEVRPKGGIPAAPYTTRWILGVGGGVLLALIVLFALRKRYAKGSGEGEA